MALREFPSLPQFPHLYNGIVCHELKGWLGASGRETLPQREPFWMRLALCHFMTVPPTSWA